MGPQTRAAPSTALAMINRRSIRFPVTLGVVLIVLVVALTVGWVIVSASAALGSEHSAVYWTLLAVGATLFVLVLVGVILYLALTVKAIRLNQRQSNFIDAVTHELKSPIASLKLYLQTLTRHQVTAEQQADFQRFMLEDVQRLDELIDHLLDAARLEHSELADGEEDVALDELLARCARLICQRYNLPESTVDLHLQPARVRARAADLEIVFRNLLDNAIKYSGDHPQVEIDTQSDGNGRVIARIGDNGPGIPPKLRRKIFGRFVRLGSELERTKRRHGLGLVHRAHLGQTIGRKNPSLEPPHRPRHNLRSRSPRGEANDHLAMKHILIVEDEEHLAIGIKYNLEAEGYLVTVVGDGPQALSFYNEHPGNVDLIILDLMLPGMSGYAVCETVRQQGGDLPILMLTARTLTEDRIRGFDAGTDIYLQKPFDLEELLSIVRNLLSRPDSPPGSHTAAAE